MEILFGVLAFLIVVILILGIYNRIIKAQLKITQAKTTIDVYLTQKFDMIPSLIHCVKENNLYEENAYNKMIQMRDEYMNNKDVSVGEKLDITLKTVMQKIEQYPNLKTNDQFLNLQKNFTKMENQLKPVRKIYNFNVKKYNRFISITPNNVIAKLFKLGKLNYFEAETNR